MKREDRLLPVITIVFYYGEEQSWDGPLCLHDMLDIPPELEPWAACIQDYRVNLVCSGTVESSHFRTGLREVFELLPLLKDKEGMKKFLETRKGSSCIWMQKRLAGVKVSECSCFEGFKRK
ncbi:Rpn family recombination-promoting nuclease/putative transposase [Blautia sp. RD014234]|nr:Rpn family recombination-promoting nuclease/putative transposase [Blautia parvula]